MVFVNIPHSTTNCGWKADSVFEVYSYPVFVYNMYVCLIPGLKRSYTCEVCSITLNSVAQYHAHLQGSKHQNKWVDHTADAELISTFNY